MTRTPPLLTLLPLLGLVVLGGCMDQMPELASPFDWQAPDEQVVHSPSSFDQEGKDSRSPVLDTLKARRSILPAGSSLDGIADLALASSTRTAEAELLTARLRSEAEDKNWLPTIGPKVSLTSLSDVVAGLVIDQVLFDHGRKKAERDYAAADVEVAAVTLSEDMNDRVYTAQSLYIEALRGRDTATLGDRALAQMAHFRRIVDGRVTGGVANKGDLRMVDARINALTTKRDTAIDSGETAQAELAAMTGSAPALSSAAPFDMTASRDVEALAVLRAAAESERAIARAGVDRAGQLPGISAVGNVLNTGSSASVDLTSDVGIGLGTPARLKAIESTKETARRQVDETREDSARARSRLQNRIRSLERQQAEAEAEAEKLARETRETYRFFEAQFRAGQRSDLEVVDIYEQTVLRELDGLEAIYDRILAQLELARDLGLLADGEAI